MKQRYHWLWLIVLGVWLVACGQDGEPTPTAVPPPVVAATPSPSATPEPPPADTAVPTDTATPTDTAKPRPPTATPTMTVPPSAGQLPDLTIRQPAPEADVVVGQSVTVSGIVSPPDTAVEAQITVAGGETLWQGTATADQAGEWTITAVLSPTITGPAQLMAQVAGTKITATVPLALVFAVDVEGTAISVDRPVPGGIAVAGRMFLFNGRVQDPINDTVTIAILDNACTTTAARQSFSVSGGSWVGYTIVSAEAALGPACAVAYTGARGAADGREVRLPVTLVSPEDEQATMLQLGNEAGLTFSAGNSTYLFGMAINATENEVSIRLEADDPARPSALLTSATAFANQYGYWEIDLAVPEAAQGQAILYITSGSTDQTYREIRIPVIVE